MNKRKYPFNIDMCPQLKIHIGEKQLANGVLKSMKMSEVYEKTKHLLYQGATASLETIVQPMVVDEIPRDIKPSKQLLLSSNGKLFKPDYTIKNSITYDDNQQRCNFCNKTVNLDFCGKCRDIFCNMCLLTLCSDVINKICLTCYN